MNANRRKYYNCVMIAKRKKCYNCVIACKRCKYYNCIIKLCGCCARSQKYFKNAKPLPLPFVFPPDKINMTAFVLH